MRTIHLARGTFRWLERQGFSMGSHRTPLFLGVCAIYAMGCGGRSPAASTPNSDGKTPLFQAAAAQSCARAKPGTGATRLGVVRQSASVALARAPSEGGKPGAVLAYVADTDEPTLHTVDISSGREVAVTELKGNPEHVMVLADGRVAVTLRGENTLEVLEPSARSTDPLSARCSVDLPSEPIAMALTPDDGTLLITSAWAHKLTILDTATLAKSAEVEVGREPRAVVVSDEGDRAFVSHLVNAQMSVVDLKTGKHEVRTMPLGTRKILGTGASQTVDPKVRLGCQGYALTKAIEVAPDGTETPAPAPVGEVPSIKPGQLDPAKPAPARPAMPGKNPQVAKKPVTIPGRLFAPFVTVDPGDGRVVYYGGPQETVGTEVSQVSVIDAAAERVLTRSVLSLRAAGSGPTHECLLPRSVAYSGGSLYVACLGIDSLVEYDARGIDPARAETRRWAVPAGPTGVAVDPVGGRAVVWSQFDRALSIVKLGEENEPVMQMALSRKAGHGLTGEMALGRVLFHKTGDSRISSEGVACASCHPDGREDAITWSTTDGPRNTPMLAGRLAETAPYSWQGNHPTLEVHLQDTMRRLRGRGLPPNETEALVSYIRTMDAPRIREAKASSGHQQLVDQGRALFFSQEAACGTCHSPDKAFTDGTKHDVRISVGAQNGGEMALDTPSLRYLSGTAPYFHDGRYATLLSMLEANDHAMGYTMHMSREQRLALTAYLESL
jgi:YVTN family beta-propeller protein